jgi:hypothetical protein
MNLFAVGALWAFIFFAFRFDARALACVRALQLAAGATALVLRYIKSIRCAEENCMDFT